MNNTRTYAVQRNVVQRLLRSIDGGYLSGFIYSDVEPHLVHLAIILINSKINDEYIPEIIEGECFELLDNLGTNDVFEAYVTLIRVIVQLATYIEKRLTSKSDYFEVIGFKGFTNGKYDLPILIVIEENKE